MRRTTYLIAVFAHVHHLRAALIVYRIWDVHHQTTAFFRTSRLGTDRIRNAVRIFVESALLYTVAVAVSAIAELAKSNAYYGTSDTVGPQQHCQFPHHSTQTRRNSA